jgi:FkbM family methyltransferase
MWAKSVVKAVLRSTGYDLRRVVPGESAPGSDVRPVGNMEYLLEDLKHRGLRCRTIIDVGANQGHWSRMAKHVFPAATCVLIEPQTEMKSSLDAFRKEFPDSHIVVAGAGPEKGVRTLTIWDDLVGSSFLPKPDSSLKAKGRQRDIEIIAIDDYLRAHGLAGPGLIKLDVQGFEIEALKGAASTFGQTEAYILEVSLFDFEDVPGIPILSEVIGFMSDRGYVAYDFAGFLRRPRDGALGQCDICFVKKDGFLRTSRSWA